MTDIAGSTELWDRFPSEMAAALDRHDTLLADAIETHGGIVIKRRLAGDSFMAVFITPSQAVLAAMSAQRALAAVPWPTTTPLRVRMAIHTGEGQPRGQDYFGRAVNHCARLREVANGGQTLLSEASYGLVRDAALPDVALRSLGQHRLRDLQVVENIVQVGPSADEGTFPPLKTVDAFPNNLPIATSSFVGRVAELEEGTAMLRASRVVTLVGPGGSGKTRLAIQLAASALESFGDGVWYVDLAPLVRDDDVLGALAALKGLQDGDPSGLRDAVAGRIGAGRELVLLDNCEHVISASRTLALWLTAHCPNLRILATSREPMHIAGEHVFSVPPMGLPLDALPTSAEEAAAYDAVALFSERARETNHRFRLTDANAGAVAELCALLDGIPLALELAAPLVTTLDVPDITARLRLFPLRDLRSLDPTIDERHRSILHVIDWSFELLDSSERAFFLQLSVFADAFSMEAIEAVCPSDDADRADLLDRLAALVRKSLVVRLETPAGARYRLLWTLRAYGRSRLATEGQLEGALDRLTDHYLALARQAGPAFSGGRQQEWILRLASEDANLELAIATLLERNHPADALELATLIWPHWYVQGRFRIGRATLARCLAAAEGRVPDEALAAALYASGTLATSLDDFDGARADLERASALWHALGNAAGEARALNSLGSALQRQDRYDKARDAWQGALAMFEALDAPVAAATVRYNLALVHECLCDLVAARVEASAALAAFQANGSLYSVGHCLTLLGMVGASQGDIPTCRRYLTESIAVFEALDDVSSAADARMRLGRALFLDDAADEGMALLRLAESAWLNAGLQAVRYGECLAYQADAALAVDDFAAAKALLDASAAVAESVNDDWLRATVMDGRGRLALQEGRLPEAHLLLQRALHLRQRRRLVMPMIESVDGLALHAAAEARWDRALALVTAAAGLRAAMGLATPVRRRRAAEDAETTAAANLDPVVADAARARARSWTLDEACAFALVPEP